MPLVVALGTLWLAATEGLATTEATAADAPTAHTEARCATCHAGGASPRHNSALISAECTTCHAEPKMVASAAGFHGNSVGRCLECHSFHEPSQVVLSVAATAGIEPSAISTTAACQTCHDARGDLASLSPAHRTAAQLYHAQAKKLENVSPSQTCLNCHSNQSDSPWQDKTGGAVIAFSEHASHPFGVAVIAGQGDSSNWIARKIDSRLPLFDGRIECQTCHLLTAGNDDLMVPFATKYDLCKGCHRHYGDRDPSLLVASISR